MAGGGAATPFAGRWTWTPALGSHGANAGRCPAMGGGGCRSTLRIKHLGSNKRMLGSRKRAAFHPLVSDRRLRQWCMGSDLWCPQLIRKRTLSKFVFLGPSRN